MIGAGSACQASRGRMQQGGRVTKCRAISLETVNAVRRFGRSRLAPAIGRKGAVCSAIGRKGAAATPQPKIEPRLTFSNHLGSVCPRLGAPRRSTATAVAVAVRRCKRLCRCSAMCLSWRPHRLSFSWARAEVIRYHDVTAAELCEPVERGVWCGKELFPVVALVEGFGGCVAAEEALSAVCRCWTLSLAARGYRSSETPCGAPAGSAP